MVCHLQRSISTTLRQALWVDPWFVSPTFSGGVFLPNQFTLEEDIKVRVPAEEEQERCISCLPGVTIVHAGVGRVWPGSCLGNWWSRLSFGEAFAEACSIKAPVPYPWYSYRQLVSIMSGKMGQDLLRHGFSSV